MTQTRKDLVKFLRDKFDPDNEGYKWVEFYGIADYIISKEFNYKRLRDWLAKEIRYYRNLKNHWKR